MQSGCMFNAWAFQEKHRDAAFKFAKQLGCQKDDPKEIVQYLKTVPAIDLVKASKFKVGRRYYVEYFYFIYFSLTKCILTK